MSAELWAITGDWQVDSNPPFDTKKDGRSIRFEDCVAQVERALIIAKERKANRFFFLGDATEHKNANNLERTMLAHHFKYASSVFEENDGIPGNHDGSLYKLSSSTLEPVGVLLPNFKYHDRFTWRDLGKERCGVFLPYLHGVSEADIAQLFKNFFGSVLSKDFKEFFLFGHYGVKGVTSGATNMVLEKDMLSLETIQAHRFKRIFMGHIHKAQTIKNAHWPGSTYSHDFGERHDVKGFILYDPDKDKVEFVELKPKHPLRQFDFLLWLDGQDSISHLAKDAIIKLTGTVPAEMETTFPTIQRKVEAELTAAGALGVYWEVERIRIAREKRSDVNTTQSFREMLQTYLKENQGKLNIEDAQFDGVLEKAWSLLESQPAFKAQFAHVQLVSVHFKDFLTFVDEKLPLTSGIHLISAENGTGKSNGLGGIYFAITGEAMTDVNLSALIRQGADKGEVTLAFRSGGDYYEIRRVISLNKSRGNATQKVHLTRNGEDIKDGGNQAAQDQTAALIGMDALAFRNTVFFVQDDPGNIIVLDGRGRKAAVMAILKMDIIGAAWELSGKLYQAENRKLEDLNVRRQTLAAISFEASAEQMEAELTSKQGSLASLRSQQASAQKQASDASASLRDLNDKRLGLSNRLAQNSDITARPNVLRLTWDSRKADFEKRLQDLRDKRDASDRSVAAWEKEIEEKKTAGAQAQSEGTRLDLERAVPKQKADECSLALDNMQEEVHKLKADLHTALNKLAELNSFNGSDTCPTCQQSVKHIHLSNEEQRTALSARIEEIRKQINEKEGLVSAKRTERQGFFDAAEVLWDKVNECTSVFMRSQADANALRQSVEREAQLRVETVSNGKTLRAEFDRAIADFDQQLAQAEKDASAASDEFRTISEAMATATGEIMQAEKTKTAAETNARSLGEQQGPVQVRIGVLESQLNQLATITSEKAAVEEQWAKASTELVLLEPLRKVFSPEGIQAAILDSVRPDLERRINSYLTRLNISKFRILLDTQATSESTGKVKETFDFLIDSVTRPQDSPMLDVRSYSGGEKQLMEVAIHMALSDVAFDRSGVRFPFFALDEVYDGLSYQNRRSLTKLIFELQADLILVVCHIEDVASEYDSIIEGSFSLEGGTKFNPKAIPPQEPRYATMAAISEAVKETKKVAPGTKGTTKRRPNKGVSTRA